MLLQAVAQPQQEQGEGPAAHFLGPEQAPRLQVSYAHLPSFVCNSLLKPQLRVSCHVQTCVALQACCV